MTKVRTMTGTILELQPSVVVQPLLFGSLFNPTVTGTLKTRAIINRMLQGQVRDAQRRVVDLTLNNMEALFVRAEDRGIERPDFRGKSTTEINNEITRFMADLRDSDIQIQENIQTAVADLANATAEMDSLEARLAEEIISEKKSKFIKANIRRDQLIQFELNFEENMADLEAELADELVRIKTELNDLGGRGGKFKINGDFKESYREDGRFSDAWPILEKIDALNKNFGALEERIRVADVEIDRLIDEDEQAPELTRAGLANPDDEIEEAIASLTVEEVDEQIDLVAESKKVINNELAEKRAILTEITQSRQIIPKVERETRVEDVSSSSDIFGGSFSFESESFSSDSFFASIPTVGEALGTQEGIQGLAGAFGVTDIHEPQFFVGDPAETLEEPQTFVQRITGLFDAINPFAGTTSESTVEDV